MLTNLAIVSSKMNLYLSSVISVFCFIFLSVPTALAQTDDQPFGLSTVVATEAVLAAAWEELQLEVDNDLSIIGRCRAAPQSCSSRAALKFIAIVKEGEQHEPLAQIGHINRAVNLAMRALDRSHVDNEWRSPLAALSRGVGDCKHYAVLKYAALREAGVAPDALKIVIVELRSTHQEHALVAVRTGNRRWLLLDNHTLTLVESSEALDHYDPLYELDQNGPRQFASPSHPPQIASSSNHRIAR